MATTDSGSEISCSLGLNMLVMNTRAIFPFVLANCTSAAIPAGAALTPSPFSLRPAQLRRAFILCSDAVTRDTCMKTDAQPEECFLRPVITGQSVEGKAAQGGYVWQPYDCRYDLMSSEDRLSCFRDKNVTRFLDFGDRCVCVCVLRVVDCCRYSVRGDSLSVVVVVVVAHQPSPRVWPVVTRLAQQLRCKMW